RVVRDRTMRSRELRLGRALRRIVLASLAAPLPACHAPDDAPAADDASVIDVEPAPDITPSKPVDAAADAAPSSCAAFSIDGAAFEPPDACADFRLLPCGVPPDAKVEDCFLDLRTCAEACGTTLIYYCQLAPVACTLEGGLVPDASAIVDCVKCA